jgi:hypothetical protein
MSTSSPFTLRSHDDLIATFRPKDQKSVVLPKFAHYPISVQNYFAWTESSNVYTYLVFKKPEWEIPMGLVFQKINSSNQNSPAGMCEWCHTPGRSDEIGLLTTSIHARKTGGTWLCLDLTCLEKIEERPGITPEKMDLAKEKVCARIGEFFQHVRDENFKNSD